MTLLRAAVRSRIGLVISAVIVALGLRVADVNPAVAQTRTITAWRLAAEPSLDPQDPVWDAILSVPVPLTAQQVTYPTGGGDLHFVNVAAAHYDGYLYLRLAWPDDTANTSSVRAEDFSDAAAVQFPATAEASVPSICMGQADQAVNIWHWRADSQEGGFSQPPLRDGYVDLYPSTEDLYFPARAGGNPFGNPSTGPVQNLVAGGFGTLSPLQDQVVEGMGLHGDDGWAVVFRRSLAAPGQWQPTLESGDVTDVAFAIWDGESGHRDGMKSVSAFAQLTVDDRSVPETGLERPGDGGQIVTIIGLTVVFGGIAVGSLLSFIRERERR